VLAIWLAVVALFMSFATVWPIGTLIGVFISVGVLFVVCWRTGERPSWQWAGKPISASRGLSYTVLITFGAIAIAMLGALITTRMQ
jgi:peptidoglycan biosynthesis protein MviN/MurJ (putative lipid II flippase)